MPKTRVVLQILVTTPRNLIYEFMSYLLLLDFISLGFDLRLFRGLEGTTNPMSHFSFQSRLIFVIFLTIYLTRLRLKLLPETKSCLAALDTPTLRLSNPGEGRTAHSRSNLLKITQNFHTKVNLNGA